MNTKPGEKMSAANARMAELAAKFVDRTRGDLAIMRTKFSKLSSGDAAALAEIRHLAHRMAGTGATLGFESLSDFAHRVEMLAERVSPGGVPEGVALAAFGGAIEALDSEFARVRSQSH